MDFHWPRFTKAFPSPHQSSLREEDELKICSRIGPGCGSPCTGCARVQQSKADVCSRIGQFEDDSGCPRASDGTHKYVVLSTYQKKRTII